MDPGGWLPVLLDGLVSNVISAVIGGLVAGVVVGYTLRGGRRQALELEARSAAARELMETVELREALGTLRDVTPLSREAVADAHRRWSAATEVNEHVMVAFEPDFAGWFTDARTWGLNSVARLPSDDEVARGQLAKGWGEARTLESAIVQWLRKGELPPRKKRSVTL